ncbi:unnamed protein product [Tilletia controversa]|nr:unnamed protein product [Tilletia controversa]CAD6938454.1 unnamed protein product [Tilletia controversa]
MPLLRRAARSGIWHGQGKQPAGLSFPVAPPPRQEPVTSLFPVNSLFATITTHTCACDANVAIFGQARTSDTASMTNGTGASPATAAAWHQQQVSQQLRRHDFAHESCSIGHARRTTCFASLTTRK